jgi:hypothetical protein
MQSPRSEDANTGSYYRHQTGNMPVNFPKIPPPKGVVDDAELERMAQEWLKQHPGSAKWEAQPGWTRQTQQSYTIETVVSELGPVVSGWCAPRVRSIA